MSTVLRTPVALLVYNRPDKTQRVFDAIAAARPSRLYIIADGPRDAEDASRCEQVRAIVRDVRWHCEVREIFSAHHMGLRDRPSSGISAVFAEEEQAIILEDDCVPHASFFEFCTELLDRYRDDERVMHIGGSNQLLGRHTVRDSYFFSQYAPVWGWATWKRAWKFYDPTFAAWPAARDAGALDHLWPTAAERRFWRLAFNLVHSGKLVTWDLQWTFALFAQEGLAAVAGMNLISNIGFGAYATNTKRWTPLSAQPTHALGDWRHPATVARDDEADRVIWKTSYYRPLWRRVEAVAWRLLQRVVTSP